MVSTVENSVRKVGFGSSGFSSFHLSIVLPRQRARGFLVCSRREPERHPHGRTGAIQRDGQLPCQAPDFLVVMAVAAHRVSLSWVCSPAAGSLILRSPAAKSVAIGFVSASSSERQG